MTHAHARGTGASATARQHMNRQDILNDFSVFFFLFQFFVVTGRPHISYLNLHPSLITMLLVSCCSE